MSEVHTMHAGTFETPADAALRKRLHCVEPETAGTLLLDIDDESGMLAYDLACHLLRGHGIDPAATRTSISTSSTSAR